MSSSETEEKRGVKRKNVLKPEENDKTKRKRNNDDKPAVATEKNSLNAHRIKKRVIVGNTSQFIPIEKREENDSYTHKWMIYIRGPKEDPDLGWLKFVRVQLHPSFKPNDIVDLFAPPYHITRRGWGQFPVKVTLFFKEPVGNKPVEIVHTLHLDQSCSGKNTVGPETVVDIEIEQPKPIAAASKSNAAAAATSQQPATTAPVSAPSAPSASTSAPAAAASAPADIKPKPKIPKIKIKTDELQIVKEGAEKPKEEEKEKPPVKKEKPEKPSAVTIKLKELKEPPPIADASGELPTEDKQKLSPKKITPKKNVKKETTASATSTSTTTSTTTATSEKPKETAASGDKPKKKKKPESFPPQTSNPMMIYATLDRELTQEEKWIREGAKKFPLISKETKPLAFLTAKTDEEFVSWNIGKRKAAEQLRAVLIRKYIKQKYKCTSYTASAIAKICRDCGFSPVIPHNESALDIIGIPTEKPPKETSPLQLVKKKSETVLKYCKYCGVYIKPQTELQNHMDECIQTQGVASLNSCTRGLESTIRSLAYAPAPNHTVARTPRNNFFDNDTNQFLQISEENESETSGESSSANYTKALQACHAAYAEECQYMRSVFKKFSTEPKSKEVETQSGNDKSNEAKAAELALYTALHCFVRSLTKESVKVYQDQKPSDTSNEDRVMVPYHVYSAVVKNPELFDFLTNNFKVPDQNAANEDAKTEEEPFS